MVGCLVDGRVVQGRLRPQDGAYKLASVAAVAFEIGGALPHNEHAVMQRMCTALYTCDAVAACLIFSRDASVGVTMASTAVLTSDGTVAVWHERRQS